MLIISFAEKSRQRNAIVSESPVAFMAWIGATIHHVGVNQNIIFDQVRLNLGGGYHNQHGIFIVPQPGIYLFSSTLMTNNDPAHLEIHGFLVVDGQVVARILGHMNNSLVDQSSQTVIVQVNKGQEVWVRNEINDSSYWGAAYSTFSGYLLMPM